MSLKRHTIIVVPHDRAKLRKYRISNRQIGALLTTTVLLSGVAGYSIWHFLSDRGGALELAELRSENADLREANRSFDESARRLQEQLSLYEDRTKQLAIIAGIERVTSPIETSQVSAETGVGGPGNPNDFLPNVPDMARRARLLGGELDLVELRFQERRRWISARPAILPVKGIFTSGYGYREDPVTGRKAFHRGIDLSAPAGNEVRATADGIVAQAGKLGGFGRAVFLAHGFGYSTRYGHLSEIAVEPGQRVKRGDVLGRVGRSGRATGYHVHYEVHEDGHTMNPLEFILDTSSRL